MMYLTCTLCTLQCTLQDQWDMAGDYDDRLPPGKGASMLLRHAGAHDVRRLRCGWAARAQLWPHPVSSLHDACCVLQVCRPRMGRL